MLFVVTVHWEVSFIVIKNIVVNTKENQIYDTEYFASKLNIK